ncbi:MAG: histidine kinase [Pseudomonadota bacterium]
MTVGTPERGLAPARSSREIALSFVYTAIFSIAISIMLWMIGASDLPSSFAISLSIGLSVNAAFVLFRIPLAQRIGEGPGALVLTALGLLLGVIIGSQLVFGRPFVILLNAPGTLVLGATFGITGYLIFGTRARLLYAQLEVEQLERRQAEQQRRLAETELRLLQAQIEPHFLFNTLGNIQSLIHDEPDKADQMLQALTILLRQSLSQTRSTESTLAEELRTVRAYLEIQSIRMGSRLSYRIDAARDTDSEPMLPLLLQPLVENAIRHGIEPQAKPGKVEVRVQRDADAIVVQIDDSGRGLTAAAAAPAKGNGTALVNLRERLAAAYGSRAELSLTERPTGGTRARLRVPATVPPSPK